MNDNINDLKEEISKLKDSADEAWAGGQKQALNWVLSVLNGEKPTTLGYNRALCETIRSKIGELTK